jgi:membrane-associated phospholipid phosphatase
MADSRFSLAQLANPAALFTAFLSKTRAEIRDWPLWWGGLTFGRRVGPLCAVLVYFAALFALHGFRSDHLTVGMSLLVLYYGGRRMGYLLDFLFPIFLIAIIYDSMRFYSDYIRGPIHVTEPYFFDKNFFGISTANGVLTPNEWWQQHTHAFLDLITGFAYLTFVGVYAITSAYIYFWVSRKGTSTRSAAYIRERRSVLGWSFFWVNLIGYSTYYWYAAAPPWYVSLYGLGPANLEARANPAGCLRFDQLLGTHFFTEMYGRSADVFGAIPSLHVAYPLLSVYFAFRFGTLRAFSVFFYILMCFSAVYLNHHYILDILWGSAYALLVAVVLDYRIGRKKSVSL